MDKQQEQMKQNQNQEAEYISGFLEEEMVEDSDFDDSVNEQEKINKLAENKQNKPEEDQPKKPKRSRKTIEQEIAELDARRERLMEKKRRQEAHEKIVFGSTVIAMLKYMKSISYGDYNEINNRIIEFTKNLKNKDKEIIIKIISKINEM